MAKVCGIYKITSPTGKIYIGQSVHINKRFTTYKNLRCKSQSKLYSSFVSHGIDNHKFEILEECSKESLNEREVFYIKKFDTFNTSHGLNLKEGGNSGVLSLESLKKIGDGNRGKKLSEETKRKISANSSRHNLGKKASTETREKIRQARFKQPDPNLGKKRTGQALQNIRDSVKHKRPLPSDIGKRISEGLLKSDKLKKTMQSPEYKEKMRIARGNYKASEETKLKLKEAWKRRKARAY